MINLARPWFSDEDLEQVKSVLQSERLVSGPMVQELEFHFEQYVSNGGKALAVNSGTSALILSLLTSEIPKGSKIIIPAFSYVATANVIELAGYQPVFCDIELSSFNIDANRVADYAEESDGIMVVHEFGNPCNMETISSIAKSFDLTLLEDAACALGSKWEGKHVGSFGISSGFSFHPRKAITSGDGGMFLTTNEKAYGQAKRLLNHGFDWDTGAPILEEPGYNFRMTEFQAVMLKGQIGRFDSELSRRKEIANIYLENIKNPKLILPGVQNAGDHSWQTFYLLCKEDGDRNKFINQLKEEGVQSGPGAQCIPNEKYYKNKYGLDVESLYPNALKANKNGLAIPLYGRLTNQEIEKIIKSINNL